MTHTIHQGDALEVLKAMPDQSVDCILTGPPYYGEPLASDDPRTIGGEETPEEYLERLIPIFAQCARTMKREAACFVMLRGDLISAHFAARVQPSGLIPQSAMSVYRSAKENLLMFRRTDAAWRKDDIDIFDDWNDDDQIIRSATMSPEIARYCIENGSNPGDTILDPFAGTGVTLSTAVSMGRNAIGIEIATSQIALIEKRMELLDSQVLERR